MQPKQPRFRFLRSADIVTERMRAARRLGAGYSLRLVIEPYLGYGNEVQLWLGGRVLEERPVVPPTPSDSARRNLANSLRRFASIEVPGARVWACSGNSRRDVLTDREGYFEISLPADALQAGWNEVSLELLSPTHPGKAPVQTSAPVLIPPHDADFGVISDIDDTLVYSDVLRPVRMVLRVLLGNAHTRVPFPGVVEFYRALNDGGRNPVFYVSNGPWNLYGVLVEFLRLQGLPLGPILLRDFGVRPMQVRALNKRRHIDAILKTYPVLPFVLIGDSSERDPEIYAQAVRDFPGRIKVIYIRSVAAEGVRTAEMEHLARDLRTENCQLIIAPNTEFAAAHAAAEGLIKPRSVTEVAEKRGHAPGNRRQSSN